MIDDNKIEETKKAFIADKKILGVMAMNDLACGFKEGAKWAINEFLNDLNDLLHPASEVPRNDNGKVLAFSKEYGYRKLYDMNDELDKTTCDTYQQMWEEQVNIFKLSDWIFVDELFDLITKGGNHD